MWNSRATCIVSSRSFKNFNYNTYQPLSKWWSRYLLVFGKSYERWMEQWTCYYYYNSKDVLCILCIAFFSIWIVRFLILIFNGIKIQSINNEKCCKIGFPSLHFNIYFTNDSWLISTATLSWKEWKDHNRFDVNGVYTEQ